jgi:hypothetical protein
VMKIRAFVMHRYVHAIINKVIFIMGTMSVPPLVPLRRDPSRQIVRARETTLWLQYLQALKRWAPSVSAVCGLRLSDADCSEATETPKTPRKSR